MIDTIRRWLGRAETKTYTSGVDRPAAWLTELLGGASTVAGVPIGPESAMQIPAVSCAVRLIGESLALAPLHLYRRTGDGKTREREHPLARIFANGPCAWQTWPEFAAGIMTDVLKYGAGRAIITRSTSGEVLELLRVHPSSVTVKQPNPTTEPVYVVRLENGGQLDYRRTDIFEVSAVDRVSPVHLGRETLGLAASLERHAASLLGRSARPGGVLTRAAPIAPAQHADTVDKFTAAFGGPDNGGRTLILPPGTDYKPLQFNSVDLQFVEMRKFAVAEIARIFRVPPVLLQELDRATFNNSEILGAHFLKFTLLYWIRAFESALRLSCLRDDERDELVIEFELSAIERADLSARMQSYRTAIESGVLTRNEARSRENLTPLPGLDEPLSPLAMRVGRGDDAPKT